MPFKIIRNDITKVEADAIVNTANPNPVYADGTDRAIYEEAGAQKLLEERRKIGKIHPGEASATGAYALKARYIIHTVGPVWRGGNDGEFETLASCYRKSLQLAKILKCKSIAFPLISTGVYGFPKDKALEIALTQFKEFLKSEEMDITLVVYDRRALELSSELVEGVEQYIDEKYVEKHKPKEYRRRLNERLEGIRRAPAKGARRVPGTGAPTLSGAQISWGELASEEREMSSGALASEEEEKALRARGFEEMEMSPDAMVFEDREMSVAAPPLEDINHHKGAPAAAGRSLQDVIKNVGETFQQMLLRLIDERGLSDPEVYKGANIDRRLFSKIRSKADYKPSKKTVLALAVALGLSLDETVDLLARAGFALSPSNKADLIVEFCISNHIYDIMEIDTILFKYGEPTLG